MKKYPLHFLVSSLLVCLLASCAPKATPDPNIQIQAAVAETLAAMPAATSVPPSTPYPAPTPVDLNGLFCEYKFCIGHPPEIAYFDVQDHLTPSSYSQGILNAYNANLFVQIMWQFAPDTKDSQFLLDLVLQGDSRAGSLDVKLIHNMNVIYTPITTTATPVLPFGAAAAWNCGDRVFAWKIYTPQAETTQALFDSTIARFTCGQ